MEHSIPWTAEEIDTLMSEVWSAPSRSLTTFSKIAQKLNKQFGNHRTGEVCSSKFHHCSKFPKYRAACPAIPGSDEHALSMDSDTISAMKCLKPGKVRKNKTTRHKSTFTTVPGTEENTVGADPSSAFAHQLFSVKHEEHLTDTDHGCTDVTQDEDGTEQSSMQVFLSEDVFSLWQQFGKRHCLETDSEVAHHLLKEFEKGSQSTNLCKTCNIPLKLCCPSCLQKEHNASTAGGTSQQKTPVASADFVCMFPERSASQGTAAVAGNSFYSPLSVLPESSSGTSNNFHKVEKPQEALNSMRTLQLRGRHVMDRTDTGAYHSELIPLETVEQDANEAFSCMFSFMKEPGQQGEGCLPDQQPLPVSSGMSSVGGGVMANKYAAQHVWPYFNDGSINARVSDGKDPFHHTPLIPHTKDNEHQQMVRREDLAANNSLLQLFQPDASPIQRKSTKKKIRRRVQAKAGVPGKAQPYTCRECSLSFSTSKNLKRHMIIHTGEKPFKCSHCSDTFKRSDGLKKHVLLIHSGSRRHSCKVCNASFPSYRLLLEHRKALGHKKMNRYHCEDCGEAFRSRSGLASHECSHSGLSEAPYKCTECSRAFKSPESLKVHIKDHSSKTYICRMCGKSCNWTAHTGQKPLVCKQCKAGEFYQTCLQSHEKIRSRVRNYVCKHCGVKFVKADRLKKHLKLHEGDELFPCPECSVSFNSKRYLQTHKRSHDVDRRRHMCDVCGMKTWSPFALRRHMLTHTGEKNHVCETCGAAFTWLTSLKYHMMRFHDKKSCICEVCGAGFIWKSELQRHMESHRKPINVIKDSDGE